MNKKPVTILIISTLVFLIGVEFYFLISTYQQTKNIKRQFKNMERSLEELKKDLDKNQNKENSTTTNTLSNKKNESEYSSKKLASPDGNRKFYYTSKDPEVEDKKIKAKDKYSNYFFAFNGIGRHVNTKFFIGDKENKNEEFKDLVHLYPKIEYSDGRIKDITNFLENFSKSLGSTKVLSWYNTSTLLLASSYGEIKSKWMSMRSIDVNNGNKEKIISCFANILEEESKAVSYCLSDDKLLLQDCFFKNENSSKIECEAASSYKIDSPVNQKELRNNPKLSKWSEKIKKEAKRIDEVKTNTFLNFYDETDKFNIDNAGQKFKVKSIHQNKDSVIWDLNSGKLEKIVN